jgi:hypothetical protein
MAPGRHLYPDARPEYSLGIPQKASMYHSQLYNTVKVDPLSYSIESQGRRSPKMTSVGFEPTEL